MRRPIDPRRLLVARFAALSAAAISALALACQEAKPLVTVYKTPSCGCCSKWADHMRAAGFEVEAVDVQSLAAVERKHRLPRQLASCHTAMVDGYVVGGHVPAAAVARLLETRPAVRGLVVPGMPPGSPGMESANPQPYTVYAFDDNGGVIYFSTHGP